jgi:hypothetical protein
MAREYRDGKDHYLLYGVESTYGTGTPSTSNRFSKLQDVNLTINNNMQISQGVGEGANATSSTYGNFDVTGSITVKPTEFAFLQFGSGSLTGAGSTADPYKLIEGDNIGYSGTFIRTATLELGAKSISNNVVYHITGSSFNNWTISGTQGEELQATVDFTGEKVKTNTSLKTYVKDDRSTFNFTSGSVGWNSESLSCTAFSVSQDHPSNYPREVFSRFGKQPTKSVRRYRWTLTMNKHYDNGASIISADELLNELFGGTGVPVDSGLPTGRNLIITVQDGTASSNKVLVLQFENSYINDWAENPSLEGGVVSVTVNGFSLAGLTDSGNNVAVKWFDRT